MNMTIHRSHARLNQQGMVAIVTTMILMIVISLIVLGFSQVVRRNQRQALDARLSSQAFYAAESGLNLAASKINENDAAYADGKNDCPAPSNAQADYEINRENDVAITCLLVKSVNDLKFDNVGSTSRVSIIDPIGTASPGSIFINWQVNHGAEPANCNQYPDLPKAGNWNCNQPLLRIDLVDLGDGTNLSQDGLISNQFSILLYPSNGGSGVTTFDPSTGATGQFGRTNCSSSRSGDKTAHCMVEIQGATSQKYAVRMMSVYGVSNVRIHASGNPQLVGAQVTVDSTARAIDVLKRIQARVSLQTDITVPNFAIDSGDGICKAYRIHAGSVLTEGGGTGDYEACSL